MASTAAVPDIAEADARLALQRAFPGKRVCLGETDGNIGFGVVFSEDPVLRHAVRLPSFADVDDAIGLLRAWEEENSQ